MIKSIRTAVKVAALGLLINIAPLAYGANGDNGDIVQIREDSPEQYVVVKGDTLWDISGEFLEDPWLWPQVWQINPQIDNPDLIYPGDIISLIYVEGQPRLVVNRDSIRDTDMNVVRMAPGIRREAIRSAVPAISLEQIGALLNQNRLVTEAEAESAPQLVDFSSGRRFGSDDDVVFAYGPWEEGITTYDIVRPRIEIHDRETGELIGLQAEMVGTADIVTLDGGQASLRIDNSVIEARIGDIFVPGIASRLQSNFFPEPPARPVRGAVVDVGFGGTRGGRHDTVIVNVGTDDGVDSGHLLTLQKADISVDNTAYKRSTAVGGRSDRVLTYNGEMFGTVLVYEAFDKHSLGLVLKSDYPVEVDDFAVTP